MKDSLCAMETNFVCRSNCNYERVIAATISASAASAYARISSSVRSCIGCGVNTRATSGNPSERDCASAAEMNSEEATNTPGMPRRSRSTMSCTLHDVQLPQSASASITTLQEMAISWRKSTGAGLVKVGLRNLFTEAPTPISRCSN